MPTSKPPAEEVREAGLLMRERAAEPEVTDVPAPPLIGPLGDLLMALGDEMADYPAARVPNGIGIASQPNKPSAVWTAAHRVALTYLRNVPRRPIYQVRHADGTVTRHVAAAHRPGFAVGLQPDGSTAALDQDVHCTACPAGYKHQPLECGENGEAENA